MQPASTAFVATLTLFCSLWLCSAYPGQGDHIESQYVGSSETVSSANGYLVTLSRTTKNGDCRALMSIRGPGIHKEVHSSCADAPNSIINLNGSLVVGDQYFSDTPSVLVHLHDDRCEKEVFSGDFGERESRVEHMDQDSCGKVKDKIRKLKEEQRNINEFYKRQATKIEREVEGMAQNITQLFNGVPYFDPQKATPNGIGVNAKITTFLLAWATISSVIHIT